MILKKYLNSKNYIRRRIQILMRGGNSRTDAMEIRENVNKNT
jgi:hypothetical protein